MQVFRRDPPLPDESVERPRGVCRAGRGETENRDPRRRVPALFKKGIRERPVAEDRADGRNGENRRQVGRDRISDRGVCRPRDLAGFDGVPERDAVPCKIRLPGVGPVGDGIAEDPSEHAPETVLRMPVVEGDLPRLDRRKTPEDQHPGVFVIYRTEPVPDPQPQEVEVPWHEVLTINHEEVGSPLKVISSIVYNEVGSSFNVECIKAQAVAVYTYLKWNGNDSHDLRGKPNPPQNVIDACRSVLGEALYYDGSYALTMFSASCAGCSANCYEVFYADYPYLRTVPSEYDEAYDPHWGTVTYMDAEEVKKIIEAKYSIKLSDKPENWIKPVYSQQTGYVTEVNIDGQTTDKGYPFSYALGLKSGKFNVAYTY